MSHYSTAKEKLIRSLMIVFWDKRTYTQDEVDKRLAASIPDELRNDPIFAPDHIRLGMVEYGLFERSEDGSIYKFNESAILGEENIKSMLGDDYPVDRIKNIDHMKKKMKKLASGFNIKFR